MTYIYVCIYIYGASQVNKVAINFLPLPAFVFFVQMCYSNSNSTNNNSSNCSSNRSNCNFNCNSNRSNDDDNRCSPRVNIFWI